MDDLKNPPRQFFRGWVAWYAWAHSGNIYLLEGKLEVTIDDQVSVIEPNTAAFLPPGSLHGLRNPGDVDARYLVVRSR